MTEHSVLIRLENISKSFGPVSVLRHVSFELRKGEIHALMGENGAGKSTLMKILAGLYHADSGCIYVDGHAVTIRNTRDAGKQGIAIIHQELNLIRELNVAENLFLGREKTGLGGVLKRHQMRELSRQYLQALHCDIDPEIEVSSLSIGQQQMVEIARALSLNARVLIMDEPTAALTDREIEALFKVIRALKDKGVGVIYVSHRMEEIFALCDRISVLRDGEFVGVQAIADTSFDQVVQQMVGRELTERFPVRNVQIGEERLRLENLCDGKRLKGINLSVRAGEIVALAGLMGAGRTEVAHALFGLSPFSEGRIILDGKEIHPKSPQAAIHEGIGFVTEDRKVQGLILGLSVRENMTLPAVPSIWKSGIVAASTERNLVNEFIERLKIRTRDAELEVASLSGGNQQKVVLAKWLALKPKVLILDEPTRGVDVGGKAEIYHIINQLAASGVAILMISSELPEVLGIADRIVVMHEYHVAGELPTDQATQETIMHLATGGN